MLLPPHSAAMQNTKAHDLTPISLSVVVARAGRRVSNPADQKKNDKRANFFDNLHSPYSGIRR